MEALLLMLRGSEAAGVSVPASYTCVRNVTRTYMTYFYILYMHILLHFYRNLLITYLFHFRSRGYTWLLTFS